jgi:saccharopine dehydrogenase-like NADP-dependent oxidoreductase
MVRNLSFKTIRYPGHLQLTRFLFEELGLKRRRDMLRTVLRYGVPDIVQDVLLIFISVRGQSEGVPTERSYVRKIYHPPMSGGQPTSAMGFASAAHVCAMLDLIRDGTVHRNGLRRHETIPFKAIEGNRFLASCLS